MLATQKSHSLKLSCPSCEEGNTLAFFGRVWTCANSHQFEATDGILNLTPQDIEPDVRERDPDYQKWMSVATEALKESYRDQSLTNRIQDAGHRKIEAWKDAPGTGWQLDLGCGLGRHFRFIPDQEKRKTVGFDGNHESLKLAKAESPVGTFIQGHAEKLPFPDHSFETVYALFSLEHILKLDRVLDEISRVLQKGRQLLVLLPAEGGWLYNSARHFTTIPYFSKKYGLDYKKVVSLEHCNTAKKVLDALKGKFRLEKSSFFPLGIGGIHLNLITLGAYCNEP